MLKDRFNLLFKKYSSKENTHRASYNTAGWISADW